MPRDGNGNYSLPTGNPVISGTTILSTWANATMPDLGQEITNSLARQGQGGMLAPLQLLDGTAGLPGMAFTNEPTTGFYRSGIGEVSYASGSALRATFKLNGNISVTATAPSVAADLTRKDYVDAFGSSLQGQIDIINVEQGVQDDRLTALEIAPGWNDYLDGYLATGLHEEYVGDLNAILTNSSYNFLGTNCTNFPVDFDGSNWGFITTYMFAQGTSNATQIVVGMNGNNDYKQWMRQREGSVWEPWKLIVDGGAFTQRLVGYQDNATHESYTGDLDSISKNSTYAFVGNQVTNAPPEFVSTETGFVQTTVLTNSTAWMIQEVTGLDGLGAGKVWQRQKQAGVWGAWRRAGGSSTFISDTPPSDPDPNGTWWDSETGNAYVYYDDGDSQQWVQEDPIGDPATELDAVMVGSVQAFPAIPPNPKWVFCNGAAVSRAAYPLLFQMIGVIYGAGNGSTTFNLPDYRGEFLRGQDAGAGVDPDAASRTDRGDGITGDAVGTKQAQEMLLHSHSIPANIEGGAVTGNPSSVATYNNRGEGAAVATNPVGGNETRPVNTYVRYYIYGV